MSSSPEVSSLFGTPVSSLQYRDINGAGAGGFAGRPGEERSKRTAENAISEAELAARISRERAEAAQQAEQKVRREYEQKLEATRSAIENAIGEFAGQRDNYFARAEAEIVQLALSIAARILHREAQVDPMLVASLVRISVEKLREGSNVTIRVAKGRAAGWREYFSTQPGMSHVDVVEEADLSGGDCLLETELGSTNLSLEAQLKEVERGFFDLLALRPTAK